MAKTVWMRRAIKGAIFVGLIAYVLKTTHFIAWFLFGLDYLCGNPSPFYELRNKYMMEMHNEWPIPLGQKVPYTPFQELFAENYTHTKFQVLSEYYTRPLIIRGLFKDTEAITWTAQHLANAIGEERQFVAVANNDVVAFDGFSTFMTSLPSVVKNISAGGNNYLFNSNFEYPTDLHLFKQIGVERLGWKPPVLVQFFLGMTRPGETRLGGSPLHAAIAPNVNVQLKGSKRWIMIDPKYRAYVKPTLLSDQVAVFCGGSYDYSSEGDRWHNFPRFEGVINPGDAIFIPSWWFHEVHNLPGAEHSLSLAVRFTNIVSSWWNNWIFTALIDFGVRHKPCLPGLRLVCFELFGKWEKNSPHAQKKSFAAEEMSRRLEQERAAKSGRNYE